MKTRIQHNSPNRNRAHCKSWGDVLTDNMNLRNEVLRLKETLGMVSSELDGMFGLFGVKPSRGSIGGVLASLRVAMSYKMFGLEAEQRELKQKLQMVIETYPHLSIELQL